MSQTLVSEPFTQGVMIKNKSQDSDNMSEFAKQAVEQIASAPHVDNNKDEVEVPVREYAQGALFEDSENDQVENNDNSSSSNDSAAPNVDGENRGFVFGTDRQVPQVQQVEVQALEAITSNSTPLSAVRLLTRKEQLLTDRVDKQRKTIKDLRAELTRNRRQIAALQRQVSSVKEIHAGFGKAKRLIETLEKQFDLRRGAVQARRNELMANAEDHDESMVNADQQQRQQQSDVLSN